MFFFFRPPISVSLPSLDGKEKRSWQILLIALNVLVIDLRFPLVCFNV
jgi:hypothetical protein